MASTYDDFITNFDLNALGSVGNEQVQQPNYEKLRKNTLWLKRKVASSDFAIQKYLARTDDCNQAQKAHTVTKEELKQTCINLKNSLERCSILEQENKVSLANQEALLRRAVNAEDKYDALLSYTNQLQALVKKLETEKEGLMVEKQLENTNDKLLQLQKEKASLLKDIKALKDTILGKKKKGKKHFKLLKSCSEPKDSKAFTSDESADEIDVKDVYKGHKSLKKVPVLNEEEIFQDNESEISIGEASRDTGCGSSRANSYKNYLNSPDYNSPEASLNIMEKDITKFFDIATSPITVHQSLSKATSPVIFDTPNLLFEDLHDDLFVRTEYCYGNSNTTDNVKSVVKKESNKSIDVCTSPELQLIDNCDFVNVRTNPISKIKDTVIKKYINKSTKKTHSSDANGTNEAKQDMLDTNIHEERKINCWCQKYYENKLKGNIKFVDACTSPVSQLSLVLIGDDTSTNNRTIENKEVKKTPEKLGITSQFAIIENENNDESSESILQSHSSEKCHSNSISHCDKFTCTDSITILERRTFIDACTSPYLESLETRKLIDKGSSPVNFLENISKTLSLDSNIITEQMGENVVASKINVPHFRTQEKICLENHNSNNLRYESTNDAEVQNIFNAMKLTPKLLSPLPRTPSNDPQLDQPYVDFMESKFKSLRKGQKRIEQNLKKTIFDMINAMNDKNYKIMKELLDPIKLHSDEVDKTMETEPNNIETTFVQPHSSTIRNLNEVEIEDIGLNVSSNTVQSNLSENSEESYISGECEISVTPAIFEKLNVRKEYDNLPDVNKTSNVTVQSNYVDKPEIIINNCTNITKSSEILTNKSVTNIEKDEMIETVSVFSKNQTDEHHENEKEINKKGEINDTTSSDNHKICTYKENSTDTNMLNLPKNIAAPKIKGKSKLEKFRDKLKPSSKIKKVVKPINKKVSEAPNIIVKETDTVSLKNKIAFENAVKVMAELKTKNNSKLHQESVRALAVSDLFGSNSPPPESKIISTRSRTRRLSKKEDEAINNASLTKPKALEDENMNKSLSNCEKRKRPADNKFDTTENSCKRAMRNSNDHKINELEIEIVADNHNVYNSEIKESKESLNEILTIGNDYFAIGNITIHDNSDADSVCNNTDGELSKNINVTSKNLAESVESDFSLNKIITVKNNVAIDKIKQIMSCNIDENMVEVKKHQDLHKTCVNNNILEASDTPLVFDLRDKGDNGKGIQDMDATILSNQNKDDEKDCNSYGTIRNKLHTDHLEVNNKNQLNMSALSGDGKIEKPSNDIILNTINQEEVLCASNKTNIVEQFLQGNENMKQNNSTKSLDHKLMRKALNITVKNPVVELIPLKNEVFTNLKNNIVSYSDLDIYEAGTNKEDQALNEPSMDNQCLNYNILCNALDRYGVNTVKFASKKTPDSVTNNICQKIEDYITIIIASPKDQQKNKMNELIHNIKIFKRKQILSGLMKYLKDPSRKCELFNKVMNGAAPSMTKAEMILLYVIEHLNVFLPSGNFIDHIYNNIEHSLFQLNSSPHFDVIESMSHFYAVMCRYFRNKSRLRCFMLDAMYCLQFKAIPLIRQCLDVCPGVLPYAHEHMAKTSLVICLVYLLHFYKCNDKFNRANEIRMILYRKYQYRFSEWNETMVLEIFRKAIMNLRGVHNDKKMLRLALIILCKRHGAVWCQTKIIQNMLVPIIQQPEVPEKIKQFCVLMLGPLLKPFPADKKAQCEIVINHLLRLLKQNPSHDMKEAIYSSLIFLNKHDQERVVQALLSWNPKTVSKDFEDILNDFVMEKPLPVWKKLLANPSQCT